MTQVNPFYNVIRVPAVGMVPGEGEDVQVDSGQDLLINADTHDTVGLVSRKYALATNGEVASIFDRAFDDMPRLSTDDHMNANTGKWIRRIVLDGERNTFVVKGEDILKTAIRIWNGYDGRTAVGFEIAAWRQVCSNGLMGWGRMFGTTLSHVHEDIIERIQSLFDIQSMKFRQVGGVFKVWSEQSFKQDDFKAFVEARIKAKERKNGYLSEKQAEALIGQYGPTLERYGDDETKWGAYNVLTAIASHEVKARKGSHLFSQGHKRMARMAADFFNENKVDDSEALVSVG